MKKIKLRPVKPLSESGFNLKISKSIVPNFFTIANMFSGYMSVIFAVFHRDLVMASWMIVLAAFLDAMDGKVARMTHSSSKFGVEYDSLADVISFGLAPSVLIYTYYFYQLKTVGIFMSFFPLLFGGIRLARFNVQLESTEKSHFIGLPSPAAANVFATYIIFMNYYFPGLILSKVLIIFTFLVSVLMVSTIHYELLPSISFRDNWQKKVTSFLYVMAIIFLILFPKTLFFPYIMLYVLSGLVRYIFAWNRSEGD
ncbi:MAG: CDP-diacylglycerol--serine O-phosphatidyltransferase [Caldithrix sp.]|nr:CDP-diacylglycerol--serine O-phosphatidyltransferase [Caldithrix sp.]